MIDANATADNPHAARAEALLRLYLDAHTPEELEQARQQAAAIVQGGEEDTAGEEPDEYARADAPDARQGGVPHPDDPHAAKLIAMLQTILGVRDESGRQAAAAQMQQIAAMPDEQVASLRHSRGWGDFLDPLRYGWDQRDSKGRFITKASVGGKQIAKRKGAKEGEDEKAEEEDVDTDVEEAEEGEPKVDEIDAAARDLAMFYADLFSAVEEAGVYVPQHHIDTADEELAESNWSIHKGDSGHWEAIERSDVEEPTQHQRLMYQRMSDLFHSDGTRTALVDFLKGCGFSATDIVKGMTEAYSMLQPK